MPSLEDLQVALVRLRAQLIGTLHRGTPTVGTCGTNPSITGGLDGGPATDQAGVVVIGSGVVATCTVTFGTTWVAAPVCLAASTNPLTAAIVVSTLSTTSFVAACSANCPSETFRYICIGG